MHIENQWAFTEQIGWQTCLSAIANTKNFARLVACDDRQSPFPSARIVKWENTFMVRKRHQFDSDCGLCRRSSMVEHLFCKQFVGGSSPLVGLSGCSLVGKTESCQGAITSSSLVSRFFISTNGALASAVATFSNWLRLQISHCSPGPFDTFSTCATKAYNGF